jgi:hypothetical protein
MDLEDFPEADQQPFECQLPPVILVNQIKKPTNQNVARNINDLPTTQLHGTQSFLAGQLTRRRPTI